MVRELPDLCVERILDFIDDLTNLINWRRGLYPFEQLSIQWKSLIERRLAKFEYLLFVTGIDFRLKNVLTSCGATLKDDPIKTISYNREDRLSLDLLSNFVPNLKVFSIASPETEEKIPRLMAEIAEFLQQNESIRGLIFEHGSTRYAEMLCPKCKSLEMLALEGYGPKRSKFVNSNQIKQLHETTPFNNSNLVENLIRLHTAAVYPDNDYFSWNFESLEILEIHLTSFTNSLDTFLNRCPHLKSAYIENMKVLNAHGVIENYHMEDLVLSYYDQRSNQTLVARINKLPQKEANHHDWSILKVFLRKFSNLKHLAIRNKQIKDSDIRELIELLPNLVLLDLRQSTGITQTSIDYVGDYCKRTKRQISIYNDENAEQIHNHWSNLSTDCVRICEGLNFMKHCFLKPFNHLPYFMIPEILD